MKSTRDHHSLAETIGGLTVVSIEEKYTKHHNRKICGLFWYDKLNLYSIQDDDSENTSYLAAHLLDRAIGGSTG